MLEATFKALGLRTREAGGPFPLIHCSWPVKALCMVPLAMRSEVGLRDGAFAVVALLLEA